MKTLFTVLFAAGMLAGCNKPADDKTERMEDQAEETADDMQEAAQETDTTAVLQ